MSFSSHPIWQAVGHALIHFVWQGVLIALAYAASLRLMRRCSANARYLAGCATLVLMLASFGFTVVRVWDADVNGVSAAQRSALRSEDELRLVDEGDTRGASDTLRSTTSDLPPNKPTLVFETLRSRAAAAASWIVAFWLLGVMLLSLRTIGGWWLTIRLKRSGNDAVVEEWREGFDALRRRLRVSRPVRLCGSTLVRVPTVIGWLSPIVLTPVGALTGLTPEQMRLLFAHELAHVRRHDYFVNLMQTLIETLLFYHPAVWWVSKRVRVLREHACDDIVVAACDGDALAYAHALVGIEEMRNLATTRLPALGSDGGSLRERITRLFKPVAEPDYAAPFSGLFSVLSLIGIVAGMSLLAPDTTKGFGAGAPKQTQRQIAVTFVSLPPLQHGGSGLDEIEHIVDKLIVKLRAHGVPAVGFVGERRVRVPGQEERRTAILRRWLHAGLELGNQTYSHKHLFKTPVAEFEQDVVRGEHVISRLVEERGSELRHFSYPYLNTGADKQSKEAIEQFLRGRGYATHKVTIDSDEYMYSFVYALAKSRNDGETMRRVRAEYLPYMKEMFAHYERMSRDVIGREIPQVLMLMASALNADTFDDLTAMMRRREYSFVTLDEAQRDPAYNQPDEHTSRYGESWLQRWGETRGVVIDEEPDVSVFVRKAYDEGVSRHRRGADEQ